MKDLINFPDKINVSIPENSFVMGLGAITVAALLQPVKDVVGIAGGHYLRAISQRMKNRFDAATEQIKAEGKTPIAPSPSIAIPLLQASVNEDSLSAIAGAQP